MGAFDQDFRPVDPSIYARTEREAADAPDGFAASRRSFLLAGLGIALTGCAGSQSNKMATELPSPFWKPHSIDTPQAEAPKAPTMQAGMPSTVVPRSQWATAAGVPVLMNPMLPVQYITVHHDGMDPFYGNDARSAAARLEAIRRAHRDKGWGDIGYHFAVDREGRVWEARSLTWQGAHVKDRNEGNIGICTLGNFDRQSPTPAQTSALSAHVAWLMQRYRVAPKRVLTHQEWPGAQTACPGMNLEHYMQAVWRKQKFA